MAKVGVLQQGYQGKLAGQSYYKGASGATIVRKITTPKNPKTLQQRVQRVITKTVGDNYKVMKAIADHSFEGRSMGFQCSNRFRSLNATRIRERAAYLQSQGISLHTYNAFEPLGSTKFIPGAMFISEGSLTQVYAQISAGKILIPCPENTYESMIGALGAQRGDQMTIVTVERDVNGNNTFHYARVILDPRNDNGAAALSVALVADSHINCPSSRNNGVFNQLAFNGGLLCKFTNGVVVAAGVIMSRKVDNKWLRSTCQLVLDETALAGDCISLIEATDTEQYSHIVLDNSEAYLNNAGVGGSEGSSSDASGSSTPVLGSSVKINGVSQTIGGGSTTANVMSNFSFLGTNLSGAAFHATRNDGAAIQPTSITDSEVKWEFSPGYTSGTFKFYMGDALKMTVTVVSGDGDGD